MIIDRFYCQSVVGGWQTFDRTIGQLIGPAFHNINDLWKWQKENI